MIPEKWIQVSLINSYELVYYPLGTDSKIVFRCGEQNTIRRDTYFCHLSGHNREYNLEASKKVGFFHNANIIPWVFEDHDRTEAIEIFLFLHFLYKSWIA